MRADKTKAMTRRGLADAAFHVALVCWLVWKISSTTMLALPTESKANTVIHGVLLLLLAASCLATPRTIGPGLLLFLGMCVVGALVKVCSDSFEIIDLAFLLFAASRFELRHVVKVCLVTVAACVVVVVALALLGVIQNYVFWRAATEPRYGLGFLYSTFLSHYYLNIVLMYAYIRRGRLRSWEMLAALVIDVVIFGATDSRNSFLLVIFTLAILKGCQLVSARHKVPPAALRLMGQWSFLLLAVASAAVVVAYDPTSQAWARMNEISSNRVSQTRTAFETYGLTPFGQEIEFSTNGLVNEGGEIKKVSEYNAAGDRNYVDSSYLNILLTKGVVTFALVMGMATLGGAKAARDGDWALCAVLFVVALHSVLDPQLINLPYSGFLFAFWNATSEWVGRTPLWGCCERRLKGWGAGR